MGLSALRGNILTPSSYANPTTLPSIKKINAAHSQLNQHIDNDGAVAVFVNWALLGRKKKSIRDSS